MAPLTRFGIRFSLSTDSHAGAITFDELARVAEAAETAGFDSVWVSDDPSAVRAPGKGALEAYTLLGALATRTRLARLGALVSPAPLRPPALLAKAVTTIDILSGGRAVLGLGTGHLGDHDDEWDRLEEAVIICRRMFSGQPASYEGRFYRVDGAANLPGPRRSGGPPIVISGDDERSLSLAAVHADACAITGPLVHVRPSLEILRRRCEAAGRDMGSLSTASMVDFQPGVPASGAAVAAVAAVAPCFQSGVAGVIVEWQAEWSPETVVRMGRALSEAYGRLEDGD